MLRVSRCDNSSKLFLYFYLLSINSLHNIFSHESPQSVLSKCLRLPGHYLWVQNKSVPNKDTPWAISSLAIYGQLHSGQTGLYISFYILFLLAKITQNLMHNSPYILLTLLIRLRYAHLLWNISIRTGDRPVYVEIIIPGILVTEIAAVDLHHFDLDRVIKDLTIASYHKSDRLLCGKFASSDTHQRSN